MPTVQNEKEESVWAAECSRD